MISEATETTDQIDGAVTASAWVFYDAHCRYCTTAANFGGRLLGRRGFRFIPLQTAWAQQRLGLRPDAPLEEMRVLTVDGQQLGGADAVIFLARQIWWASPLALVAKIPGVHRLLDRGYRWIAAHRGCKDLSCKLSSGAAKLPQFKERRSPVRRLRRISAAGRPPLGFCAPEPVHGAFAVAKPSVSRRTGDRHSLIQTTIPCAALVAIAFTAQPYLPRWAFMWTMTAAIFFSCKWLTFSRAKPRLGKVSPPLLIGYFLLWPGLDASGFLGGRPSHLRRAAEAKVLLRGIFKTALGAILLFGLARLSPDPLLAGWVGMAGLIFLLHFGLFDIAAVFWRMRGVNAAPIMERPVAATSLSEFWGRRWNAAFNQLVLVLFFRNFARRFGTIRATLAAFFISGLLHELVISLPAGGGYGLPTGYFLLQAWAIVAQRLPVAARLHLRRRFGGWLFTMFFTAAPAFWLFHPLFVRRVIIPFMQAIGAL